MRNRRGRSNKTGGRGPPRVSTRGVSFLGKRDAVSLCSRRRNAHCKPTLAVALRVTFPCRFGRMLSSRSPGTVLAMLSPLALRSHSLLIVLVIAANLPCTFATCPHCHGHFSSCTFDTDGGSCPTIAVVTSNAAAIAAGAGSIWRPGPRTGGPVFFLSLTS